MARPPIISDLPSCADIRRSIQVYIDEAYAGRVPEPIRQLIPPEQGDCAGWLMTDAVERDPPRGELEAVRSFALRLGNPVYRHMKLRICRPPHERLWIFLVDAHDAVLRAPQDSPDHATMLEMKRRNAAIAAAITRRLEDAGLPTERTYLRWKLEQSGQEKGQAPQGS